MSCASSLCAPHGGDRQAEPPTQEWPAFQAGPSAQSRQEL